VRVTSFRFATMIVIAILSRTVPTLAQEMTSASNDTSALLDAQAYLRLLGPASEFAARILAGLGNPVFVHGAIPNGEAVPSVSSVAAEFHP